MAATWRIDGIASKQLDDGHYYYARLLEFPWAVFYRYRSDAPAESIDEVVAAPVMFTIAAHKSMLARGEWAVIATADPDPALAPPAEQAVWDGPDECQIIDADGEMRPATPEECHGLEPAAVWEPLHIADRVKDSYAGRPNPWLEDLINPPF